MSNEIYKFVNDVVSKNFIVIFSKTYCPYCHHVKDLFTRLNAPYVIIELDLRKDGNEIQDVMEKLTGARTVPRVFIDGKFVGGAQEINALHRTGKLENLLKKK